MSDHASFESEQAVLGALLADSETYDRIADVLDPEIFAVAAHRVMCQEAIALIRERKPCDAVVLLSRLQEKGLTPNPVPGDLPMRLAAQVGITANVRHYVGTLRSLWAHRRARGVAQEILADERQISGEELVGDFGRKLSEIEVHRGRELRPLGAACMEVVQRFERARSGEVMPERFWKTGFSRLDGLTGGIAAGKLTIIGARPQMGKTALMMALADNLAAHGTPVAIFELEDEEETLARRALARRAKIATTLLRGSGKGLRDEHWAKLGDASMLKTYDFPIFVDDTHGLTAEDVAGRMRRYAREKNVRLFFLDHLLELVFHDRRDGRRDIAIGESLSLLRDTAKTLDAGLVVLHQLSRDIEKRKDPTPTLSDLKDSGDIEQKARLIIFLARRGKDFILDVAKQSEGPKGQVILDWLEDSMGIEDRRVD